MFCSNTLSFYLKKLEKDQTKSKATRWKKITEEIDEVENSKILKTS